MLVSLTLLDFFTSSLEVLVYDHRLVAVDSSFSDPLFVPHVVFLLERSCFSSAVSLKLLACLYLL